jgi:hypothetical protein
MRNNLYTPIITQTHSLMQTLFVLQMRAAQNRVREREQTYELIKNHIKEAKENGRNQHR